MKKKVTDQYVRDAVPKMVKRMTSSLNEEGGADIESLGLFGDFRRRKTHLFGILRPLKH